MRCSAIFAPESVPVPKQFQNRIVGRIIHCRSGADKDSCITLALSRCSRARLLLGLTLVMTCVFFGRHLCLPSPDTSTNQHGSQRTTTPKRVTGSSLLIESPTGTLRASVPEANPSRSYGRVVMDWNSGCAKAVRQGCVDGKKLFHLARRLLRGLRFISVWCSMFLRLATNSGTVAKLTVERDRHHGREIPCGVSICCLL